MLTVRPSVLAAALMVGFQLILLGCGSGALGRWSDAGDAEYLAQRSLENARRSASTPEGRARLYDQLIRTAEAEKAYIHQTGLFYEGIHPYVHEQLREALDHYNEAIRIFPDSSRARMGRQELIAFVEEQAPVWAATAEINDKPSVTLDEITAAVQAVSEPIQAELARRNAELEAENRRRLAEVQQEARRREEAERRRRVREAERQREEARREREAAERRQDAGPPALGPAPTIGPTESERSEAELEEQRRREEEARSRGEEERRRQEEERQRREDASRTPAWVDPASPHPPCRGQGLDMFTESSVRAKCAMFRQNHELVDGFRRSARTITITVHSSCEVDHGSLQDGDVSSEGVLLRLEGAITGTNRLTGAWFGTGLPRFDSGAGAIELPTGREDTQGSDWLSPRWQQYRITYDPRRHGSGPPLTFEWRRLRRGPGLGKSGTRTTRVVDRGVYDFQGRSTGNLPACFR